MTAGRSRVLMLVWTSVATDTRVLREASTLTSMGRAVHIIGRAVPSDFVPPPGITVASMGTAPLSSTRTRRLSRAERAARWALLPTHVTRQIAAWQRDAEAAAAAWAEAEGAPEVVHAHDFSALPVGHRLAQRWDVPLVYDTHEYWVGRPVEGRPAPLLRRAERLAEARLGVDAAAVVTVGPGVARALRIDHPDWPEITVVRNTFPSRPAAAAPGGPLDAPVGLVYPGRLAAYRELEVVSRASRLIDLPVTLVGPADEAWLSGFDRGRAEVLASESLRSIDHRLQTAGAALVTHSDRWPNHRLALPNKLFHAVSLGVPVVATDVGELGAAVREHRLGTLYAPGDSASLVRAVGELVAHYSHHRCAVAAARQHLVWERDADSLRGLYRALAPTGR
ncbi:MAG: glycosyltransferase [Micrococcales bacterium]|nr:glycosyltransferase [Micrococcales bacterium]